MDCCRHLFNIFSRVDQRLWSGKLHSLLQLRLLLHPSHHPHHHQLSHLPQDLVQRLQQQQLQPQDVGEGKSWNIFHSFERKYSQDVQTRANTTETVVRAGAKPKLSVYNFRSSSDIISRAKIKSVKLTLVIIAFYILCSSPFVLSQLLTSLGPLHVR